MCRRCQFLYVYLSTWLHWTTVSDRYDYSELLVIIFVSATLKSTATSKSTGFTARFWRSCLIDWLIDWLIVTQLKLKMLSSLPYGILECGNIVAFCSTTFGRQLVLMLGVLTRVLIRRSDFLCHAGPELYVTKHQNCWLQLNAVHTAESEFTVFVTETFCYAKYLAKSDDLKSNKNCR